LRQTASGRYSVTVVMSVLLRDSALRHIAVA
jgi:hypothetical protein